MKVSRENWQELSMSEMGKLFDEEFKDVHAKARPNIAAARELQHLKNATIELISSNEKHAVYRIMETDRIFEMLSSGVFEEYNTLEDYKNNQSVLDKDIVNL